ncbi:uncharacterized protein [Scyliorhinus torazame]|uniref:uncharacterized protein isoform X2 n=1 Tax=Scyliorhinus torazame TaxID=75743 RepID=UPI003B5C5775
MEKGGESGQIAVDPLEQRQRRQAKTKMASEGGSLTWGPEQQEFLKCCVEEIKKEMKKELLAPILQAIEGLKEEQKTQERELRVVKAKAAENEDDIQGLVVKTETQEARQKRCVERLEALENDARRNNLRILGLPEGVEGADVGAYVSMMLHSLMGAEAPAGPLEVEGAYRVMARGPRAGEISRAIVVRFLRFKDREMVLRWAKKTRSSKWEKAVIRVYQDWSAEVARRRASFNRAKAVLHKKKIKFGMLQPARMWVTYRGRHHYFETADEAWTFIVEEKLE